MTETTPAAVIVDPPAKASPEPTAPEGTEEAETVTLCVRHGAIPWNFGYPSADGASTLLITPTGTQVPADVADEIIASAAEHNILVEVQK